MLSSKEPLLIVCIGSLLWSMLLEVLGLNPSAATNCPFITSLSFWFLTFGYMDHAGWLWELYVNACKSPDPMLGLYSGSSVNISPFPHFFPAASGISGPWNLNPKLQLLKWLCSLHVTEVIEGMVNGSWNGCIGFIASLCLSLGRTLTDVDSAPGHIWVAQFLLQ